MIRTPTTFILGAGASLDCGFPLGNGLVRHIVESIAGGRAEHVARWVGEDVAMVQQFARELAESNIDTIDAWLEKRPAFLKIGKASIAQTIARFERPGELNSGWYRVLWQRLTMGANNPKDFFHGNNVHFITYNYDRSLEQFLSKSFFGTYGVHYQEHGTLPIYHVHGMAGGFNYLKAEVGARPYSAIDDFSQVGWEHAKMASQRIQVMFEKSDYDYVINNVVPWIEKSQRIFFLGCGYHKVNLQKIRYEYNRNDSKEIYGTYFPPCRDKNAVRDYERNGFGLPIEVFGDNRTITDLLHDRLPIDD